MSAPAKLQRLQVAARLHELSAYLRLFSEAPYRARAYETAARALEALGPRYDSLLAAGRLTEVPGVGEKIAAVIRELAKSGTIPALDRYNAELPYALVALAELPGITLPRLRKLRDTLGIDTADTLEAAARAGRLRTVPGFGPRTEEKILASLSRRKTAPRQLLLSTARDVAAQIALHLREIPGVTAVQVSGEVRRWVEVVTEVSLLAAASDPVVALSAFAKTPLVGQTLPDVDLDVDKAPAPSMRRLRFALLQGGTAVVEIVTPPAFAAALVRTTGSQAHVADLQARAAAQATSLATLPGDSEAAIYAALDLPEIPPELRDEPVDVVMAREGRDFSDLLTMSDIQGFVHCHTTASDGRYDLASMAAGAATRGMHYLTVTDHSPTASYAGGLSIERLLEQGAEIDGFNEGGGAGVDVLRGTESDIRADGTLDYPIDVLETLDVVIASIHNRFSMNEDQMTVRLVTAMRQPVFKIWGHGLGQLLLHRPPVACRVQEVLQAAATLGRTAVEINGDPHRMDLPAHWLRPARALGLPFVVSVDAHSLRNYDNLIYGVHLARRAGIRRDEVLNTRDSAGFRAAVHPRRGAP